VAKKNGVVVNEFSIGMGPRIFSRVAKSGTRYSIKILPLGGSCAMLGEDEDNEEEGSFNSKSVWARMAIVFAGPFFNFILAFVLSLIVIGFVGTDISYVRVLDTDSAAYEAGLREGDRITKYNGSAVAIGREIYIDQYVNALDGSDITLSFVRDGKKYNIQYTPDSEDRYMVGMSYSQDSSQAQISAVAENSVMEEAGVQVGDVVLAIDGNKISSGEDMVNYIAENPFSDKEVTFTLKRNSKEFDISIVPRITKAYTIGFSYNLAREKQSFGNVIKYSLVEVRYEINTVLKSLKMLVTGQVSAQEISGPVGIVDLIGDTYTETKSEGASITILSLMNLAIMLSANLGVMNLLPLPALDGGRIFLYLVEIITRRKIPKDKEGMIHFIGFILLMILMVFLIFNDIRKLL
jgi:regulator of sigma E protease